MWRKGQAEGMNNIFHGNQIFDSQICSAATIEKKICVTKSDFTGTEEYLNQMYSLLFTKYKIAEMFTRLCLLVFQLADANY
jgi:hypothetical protein